MDGGSEGRKKSEKKVGITNFEDLATPRRIR